MRFIPIPIAILICLSWITGLAGQENSASKTKILLIGKSPDHPHGTHMYMYTSKVLAKCLEQNGEIETVVSNGWPKDSETLKDVKTIVLYSTPGAEFLLDADSAGQFHDAMRSGVGLVTLHWASSVFEKNLPRLGDDWGKYLGGFWVSNYGLSTDKSNLKQLEPNHPICRGWKEYELHDEYYLKPVMKEATPLLRVSTKGEDVIVGWAHERPNNGRAFGTTLGHFYRNFQIDAFRRMVVNAILWTAHVEVPRDGANVELSESDLALPPAPPKPKRNANAAIPNNFKDQNLVAWCIVPFDSKERSPAERAEMIKRIGMKRVAYDWRKKHVPTFEEEIIQYRKHGIEYFAFWSVHDEALALFEKHGLRPQIWMMMAQPTGKTQEARVKEAAESLLPLVKRTRQLGSKLGIYNHGGWSGEPENMIAVCEYLRENHDADHVGIVYNLHHGHSHLDRFAAIVKSMKPYLLCLNLNGMTRDGDKQSKKILPIGAGELDSRLIRTIQNAKYDGPIGIIGHTQDDVEERLKDNLDGLHWVLQKSAGKKPEYRTYK